MPSKTTPTVLYSAPESPEVQECSSLESKNFGERKLSIS